MMLIEASWPSNRLAAVTNLTGFTGRWRAVWAGSAEVELTNPEYLEIKLFVDRPLGGPGALASLAMRRPLPFDPIEEAGRQWELRWDQVEAMQAATSIMRAQQILLARVDEALRPWDLSFARYEVLILLHFSREGRLPLGKMGERLMLHQASVTNLVDRLEGQGYIERQPHPTDRRTTLAALTPAGRSIVEPATRAVVDARVGLAELSSADAMRVHRSLRPLRAGAGDFDPNVRSRG